MRGNDSKGGGTKLSPGSRFSGGRPPDATLTYKAMEMVAKGGTTLEYCKGLKERNDLLLRCPTGGRASMSQLHHGGGGKVQAARKPKFLAGKRTRSAKPRREMNMNEAPIVKFERETPLGFESSPFQMFPPSITVSPQLAMNGFVGRTDPTRSAHPADVELCILGEGEALGEAEAATAQAKYPASAIAVLPLEVLQVSKSDLQEVVAALPYQQRRDFVAAARKRLNWRKHHLQYVVSKM